LVSVTFIPSIIYSMIKFSKYQGTGNDFIMIDNRPLLAKLSQPEIAQLCHRRMGIGADGMILLQNHPELDFEMVYYNSDGNPSSMCGNGGRCIAAFAAQLGIESPTGILKFMAVDGIHEAVLETPLKDGFKVNLKMQDVQEVLLRESYAVLNTGSPHFVVRVNDVEGIDIIKQAHSIRYSEQFKEKGINVNFIQKVGDDLKVRTYERGVEDETWSCGTGVVASAIASSLFTGNLPQQIQTKGGVLSVQFTTDDQQRFTNIHLIGPALKVFDGYF
jgi:diaminopimelate epimerase